MDNTSARQFAGVDTSFQDRGLPQANAPVDTPLPGVMRGGQDRYLAEIYAIRKNQFTPPRPIFAGGNQTVNM